MPVSLASLSMQGCVSTPVSLTKFSEIAIIFSFDLSCSTARIPCGFYILHLYILTIRHAKQIFSQYELPGFKGTVL